jgi:hypothetical protein
MFDKSNRWKEEGVLIGHFPFLGDIMFDKSNRYIYFLLDFVAVGFIRLFQIFQYRNYFLLLGCVQVSDIVH